MTIRDMFRGISRVVAEAFAAVHKRVPEEQMAAGIFLVRAAARQFATPSERRMWVALQLMARFHVPEHNARLIVELAVAHVKDAAGGNAPEREAA